MTPLQQAIANIRSAMGLSNTPSDWTYDERVAYNNALAAWVNANPSQVSAAELAVAQGNLNSTSLDSTSFLSEVGDFGGYLEDEIIAAGNDIGGIGRGVFNLASISSWLIPLVGISVVGILLYKLFKK